MRRALVLGLAGAAIAGCIGEEPVLPTIPKCEAPNVLCGGSCVSTNEDPLHCGDCETACADGEACHDGLCGCGDGALECDDGCVNYLGDPFHCGNCNTVCDTQAGEVCSLGQCTIGCGGGTELCGDACVNTTYDAEHCGSCDEACAAGEVCANGKCALSCSGGTTRCGKSCVETDTDPAHCGDCNTTCDAAAGEVCVDGECVGACADGNCPLSCAGGTTLCDDACRDLDVDPANCGACNVRCDELAACSGGKCVCPDGYAGNGKSCSDIDECASANDCSPSGECINTDGGHVCRCKDEQSGDGKSCTGIALVSETLTGSASGADVLSIRLNEDGRYVAFTTLSRDIVTLYTYYLPQVFLRDVSARSTQVVSVSITGGEPDGEAQAPIAISGDGNVVAFQSWASNIDGNNSDTAVDVFARDMSETRTIIQSQDGTSAPPPPGASGNPTVSADGRFVAFNSERALVDGADPYGVGVYRVESGTHDWELIDVNASGAEPEWDFDHCSEGNPISQLPSLSGDGSRVVFVTNGVGLTDEYDENCHDDVFLRDLGNPAKPVTTLLSPSETGGYTCSSNATGSAWPTISVDGKWVAFDSGCVDLVGTDLSDYRDVFLRDLAHDKLLKLSVNKDGGEANGDSMLPQVSADGRYVAFVSNASDLVDNDTNGQSDVFVRDVVAGTTTRVSLNRNGDQLATGASSFGFASNGAVVAFTTADKILANDTNNTTDIYLRYLR